MPNHVTHKLIFTGDALEHIVDECCTEGGIDFDKLIPTPGHVYLSDTTAEDEKDFPMNWSSWNRLYWGVKWNAYAGSAGRNDDGTAYLKFDTAWGIPYPIITAFANKFRVQFEHRYFDEGHNFWGAEKWEESCGTMRRVMKRKSAEEDKVALCIELKGYDPDKEA